MGKRYVGKTVRVLVEPPRAGETRMGGFTEQYLPVRFEDRPPAGDLVEALVLGEMTGVLLVSVAALNEEKARM